MDEIKAQVVVTEYTVCAHPDPQQWRYHAVYAQRLGGTEKWIVTSSRNGSPQERLDVMCQWSMAPGGDEYDRWRQRTEFDEQIALTLAREAAVAEIRTREAMKATGAKLAAAGLNYDQVLRFLNTAAAHGEWKAHPDSAPLTEAKRDAVAEFGAHAGFEVFWRGPVGERKSAYSMQAQPIWEVRVVPQGAPAADADRYPHAQCRGELPHHGHVWGEDPDPRHWCKGLWTMAAVAREAAMFRQEMEMGRPCASVPPGAGAVGREPNQ